jgi:hypothetical protein
MRSLAGVLHGIRHSESRIGKVPQKRFLAKAENPVVVVTEAGSYLRLIDSCITQLKAQGSSRGPVTRVKQKKKKGVDSHLDPGLKTGNLIRTSISEKYDLARKITTHVKLPVTSQSKCVVIFVANSIGDPRSRISQKYSPR